MPNSLSITTIGTWALAIKRTLDANGINGDDILRRAEIDVDACADPNTRLNANQINQLWSLAEQATGDYHFALSVPMHVHATTMHAMTMANYAAFSLRDALERAVRFHRIVTTGLTITLRDNADTIDVIFSPVAENSITRHGIEASLFLNLKMGREIVLGSTQQAVGVYLKRNEHDDKQKLEQLFGCPVHFNAEEWMVRLDRESTEQPLATANPEIIQSCEKIMVDYLARMDKANISYRVYQLILELLSSGEPTQERIADQLHMSTRSLHRKLTSVGTNFKTLLDNTRRDLALQYIRQSNLSIADITYNLGFYDASSFSRAFKRWTGMSPAKYRKQQLNFLEGH